MPYKSKEDKRRQQTLWAQNNRTKTRAASKRWMNAHPEKVRAAHRQRKYGITPEQYADLLTIQNGRCGMPQCKTPLPGGKGTWNVDHDHASGKPRGLLCHKCNLALGHYENNKSRHKEFEEYLKRSPFEFLSLPEDTVNVH